MATTTNGLLLWADDEMELLRPHLLFLEKKGYEVVTVTNGLDAVERCQERQFDVVLLDEMMPGLSGLETLQRIKQIQPTVPVVMVTKSEEEDIMNEAVGRNIADYLIKPVNPNQILLTLKKLIHRRELVAETTQTAYQQQFGQLGMQIIDCRTWQDWCDVYKQLVRWELELTATDSAMSDMLRMQKEEANLGFGKFVKQHYMQWIAARAPQQAAAGRRTASAAPDATQPPFLSPDVFKRHVFPLLSEGLPVWLIVLDNFRYDQWKTIEPELADYEIDEQVYCSILPTATQYARNAIFSGLMPEQIERMFPELWVDEDAEEGKNINEMPLIKTQIERFRRHDTFSYHKINTAAEAERLMGQLETLKKTQLNVVVFNFIDMLSHARTESKMVRELAHDEAAYRSLTLSWFRHSALSQLLRQLAQTNCRVVLTTDHGSIRTTTPVKIVGDRNTNTNLRYKLGKNLSYSDRDVFTVREPQKAQLPSPNLSTSYVFATGDSFFAYPNNYNYYVSYYRNTFQHGGISMEEMMIPLVVLKGRKQQ